MIKVKRTPLYEEHVKLGARVVEFGGWEMPLNYLPGILAEHLATRKFGGLFDVSHMGRFLISGQDALSFLQYVLSNNAAALESGQSQYTIITKESGGAVDDAYLYRMDENEYLLVVNAANTEKDWVWFQKCKQRFSQLKLEDCSARIAMLALQGPRAKAVLEIIIGDIRKLPEPIRNSLATIEIFGTKVPIARTGYTGEPICFELFPPAEIVVRLWSELLEVGKAEGIIPVGLGARDTLRLEAGLSLYSHELGIDVEGKEIPVFALPVARLAVSFGKIKGEYIGREVLMKQFQETKFRQEGRLDTPKERLFVPRIIMPMAISEGGIARAGCQVYVDESPVGNVTSGTMVPYWKTEGTGVKSEPGAESGRRAISLAYLDADLREGQRTKIVVRDKVIEGMIVERHVGSEAAPYARPLLIEY
ncbi:glycine cleavage system aminomethyltransferase GcvT [Chloroflexota bacterium]